MEKGRRLVLLDELGDGTSTGNGGNSDHDAASFIWSGSLCRNVVDVLPQEEAVHVIECCMLVPGEYKFAVLCTRTKNKTSSPKSPTESGQLRCWSSHPLTCLVT